MDRCHHEYISRFPVNNIGRKIKKRKTKISLFYFNVNDYESVLIMEFELHSREKKDRLNCMIWLVAKVDN